jgi:CRISPR/Cas system-associated protein Cas5 (RAMP superfamily)
MVKIETDIIINTDGIRQELISSLKTLENLKRFMWQKERNEIKKIINEFTDEQLIQLLTEKEIKDQKKYEKYLEKQEPKHKKKFDDFYNNQFDKFFRTHNFTTN